MELNATPTYLLQVSPNCSLNWQQATLFFAGVCTGSLGIALVLAWHGYWPVLPFAGLEMVVLGTALWVTMRRGRYREVIQIFDDRIEIEKGTPEQRGNMVFPLHWARVTLRPARVASYPSRLLISSHGRSCEIGSCLTEKERKRLHVRLEQLLGRVEQTQPCGPVGN